MGTKAFRSIFIISLVICLVRISPPRAAQARAEIGLPSLETFIAKVENGQAAVLRGIYVPEVFASEVVQQPAGDASYVSPIEDTLTQFQLTSRFGSTGLLAHNLLAGRPFFLLTKGQIFYLVYGDGETKTFVVTKTLRYQALQPESVKSKFVDLTTSQTLSAAELLRKAYNRPGHVILQTCIYSDGNPSWGRLFVIAKPYRADSAESKSQRISP